MTIQIQNAPNSISLKKIGKALDVDFAAMPQASLEHVFAYGIRQILNDAMASAKTEAEAMGAARKRLDNLMNGTLRASPVREGDPIKARAMDLALTAINGAPKFIEWRKANNLKQSDKPAIAKAREQAQKLIAVEGNKFTAQAKIDVEAAKGLGEVEIDLD